MSTQAKGHRSRTDKSLSKQISRGNSHNMESLRQESQVLSQTRGPHFREFGAMERLHWVMGLNHPNHFAVAADVNGETTPAMWRRALNELQCRHPFLNVCIARNAKSKLVYQRVAGREIPLAVKTLTSVFQWQEEFENELATPFDAYSAPLMRALLLHSERKCIIILTTHHAIADGMSLVFIIRDLMQALSGKSLVQLPVSPSQEELSSQPPAVSFPVTPTTTANVPTTEPLANPRFRNGERPQVHGLRLTPEQTTLFVRTVRQEQTSIHAALCAALVLAGRELSSSWKGSPVLVLSPISLRKTLNIGEDCVLAMTAAVVPFDQSQNDNLWELARWAKQSLQSAQASQGPALPEIMQQAIAHDNDAEALTQFLSLGLSYQLAVTNIQRLPFENRFGNFTVEAIWGPSALNGLDGEQAVAVATVDDSLCLVHTSYTPFHLFLEKAVQLLLEACSQTEASRHQISTVKTRR